MTLEYQTTEFDQNKTIETILKREFLLSNRLWSKLKQQHRIQMNGQEVGSYLCPPCGAVLSVVLAEKEVEDTTVPQEGPLTICYEDDWYLAVNKPASLVVHPCAYHPDHTLSNYVKAHVGNTCKPRPINRLDHGTSGIVLFAKHEYIQECFLRISPKPKKEYWAIVEGFWEQKEGVISLPIARKQASIIEREVNWEIGQEAITQYQVMREFLWQGEPLSLVAIQLKTGRTHQIRVHMAAMGHPVVGDTLYGKAHPNILRQALHAYRLEWTHAISKQRVEVFAELPEDMKQLLEESVTIS